MPDQGLAPWVSANDKPSTTAGSKPVSGDATERRLKGEVMQLPARDRRRIKDLIHNDVGLYHAAEPSSLSRADHIRQFDPYESLANVFTDHARTRPARTAEVPPSAAGGLSRMSACNLPPPHFGFLNARTPLG